MKRIVLAALISTALPLAAQQPATPPASAPAAPPAATAAAPKPVWALISAVGNKLSYVRERAQTGSHFEPYQRYTVDIPGTQVDRAVFRGLENIVRRNAPGADVIYARLNPEELKGVTAHERGDIAIGKLASALDKMPERQNWHRIVIITPKYVRTEREGLASKLEGIGFFVKRFDTTLDPAEYGVQGEEEMVDLEGKPSRGKTYIAPYFNAQVWVLDAKTMEVLETSERYDFQKIHDPMSTALNVEASIPLDRLALSLERFVERSAERSLREAIGVVTVSDPRQVDGKPAEPKKK